MYTCTSIVVVLGSARVTKQLKGNPNRVSVTSCSTVAGCAAVNNVAHVILVDTCAVCQRRHVTVASGWVGNMPNFRSFSELHYANLSETNKTLVIYMVNYTLKNKQSM